MCYSALVRKDIEKLEKEFAATINRDLWKYVYETEVIDPKKIKFRNYGEQIYPHYIAPVLHMKNEKLTISPMFYSTFLSPHFSLNPQKKWTTFNARRDNLNSPFWGDAFLKNHGLVILRGFCEWVEVKDLLNARVLSPESIKKNFESQIHARKKAWVEKGKSESSFRLSKTEQIDPRFRKTIIKFEPQSGHSIISPVIFNYSAHSESPLGGFAIITDSPTPEIEAAGHDRCPVNLKLQAINQWLNTNQLTSQQADQILVQQVEEYYQHQLLKIA